MKRIIENTRHEAQYSWPEEVFIQGGDIGVGYAGENSYRTAFVEAFPGNTFLRGEGRTIIEAEDACWKKYLTWRDCDGSGNKHGPYERRQYRNGAGFCTRCGTWMSKVFESLPEEQNPKRGRTLVEQVFVDQDLEAVTKVIDLVTRAEELPQGPPEGTHGK